MDNGVCYPLLFAVTWIHCLELECHVLVQLHVIDSNINLSSHPSYQTLYFYCPSMLKWRARMHAVERKTDRKYKMKNEMS